jgi:hypothetical protein
MGLVAAIAATVFAVHDRKPTIWRAVPARLYRNGILDPQGVAYVSRSGAIAFGMPSNNPELRVEYAYMPRWNMVCDLNIVRFYCFPGFAVATHTDGWVPIDGAKSHDPNVSVTHTGAWSRLQFAGMQGRRRVSRRHFPPTRPWPEWRPTQAE